jgi:hypothetical protein
MKINETMEKKNIKKEAKKVKLTAKQQMEAVKELDYSIKQVVNVLQRSNNNLGISYCLEVIFNNIFDGDVKKMDAFILETKIKELITGLEELNESLNKSLGVN